MGRDVARAGRTHEAFRGEMPPDPRDRRSLSAGSTDASALSVTSDFVCETWAPNNRSAPHPTNLVFVAHPERLPKGSPSVPELRGQIDRLDQWRPHPARNATYLLVLDSDDPATIAAAVAAAVPMGVMPLGRPSTVGIVSLNPNVSSSAIADALRAREIDYVQRVRADLASESAQVVADDPEMQNMLEAIDMTAEQYVEDRNARAEAALSAPPTVAGYSLMLLNDPAMLGES